MYRILHIYPVNQFSKEAYFTDKPFDLYVNAITYFFNFCNYNNYEVIICNVKDNHFVAINKLTKASITLYYTDSK